MVYVVNHRQGDKYIYMTLVNILTIYNSMSRLEWKIIIVNRSRPFRDDVFRKYVIILFMNSIDPIMIYKDKKR